MGAVGIGSTDFLKSELSFDFYNPILSIDQSDKVVFYIGSMMGYVNGLNTDTTIAPIELYRMGGNGLTTFGTTPLRGYPAQSVEDVGGKLQAKFTAELRFAVTMNPMPIYV